MKILNNGDNFFETCGKRPRGVHTTACDRGEIRGLYRAGHSVEDIFQRTGWSLKTIEHTINTTERERKACHRPRFTFKADIDYLVLLDEHIEEDPSLSCEELKTLMDAATGRRACRYKSQLDCCISC